MTRHLTCQPQSAPRRRLNARTRLLAAAIAACYAAAPAWSLPTAPTVASGSASFAQSGNVLTVTNSNGAIIHWDRFNIGANETTRFVQSSASSAVMNRVLSADPSQIYGTLTSNGRVWLINPAGIMVGPGARIDTAGFVASTLNISDQNFLAGRLTFQGAAGAGNVVNQGSIVTPAGGSVYLIGANVGNEGIITTPGGETILAAGQTVSIHDTATPGIKVEITGAAGNVTNLGDIVADAGRIGMAGVIVRNSGTANASSVVNDGGRVFLRASKEAYVDGAGRIVATGRKGGHAEVLGERVAVMGNAAIDVSGSQGGGTALVGGDFQGKNPDVLNATETYLGPQARITADATGKGDGGKVVVWADGSTRAYGTVSARGGANGGNGGFVEISGKQSLDFATKVDLRAPQGHTGTLLLDPSSIDIYAGSGTDDYGYGGSLTGTPWLLSGGSSGATIYGATIYGALLTADLVLTTGDGGTGNITVHSGTYNADASNTNDLTLLAYGGGASVGNVSVSGAVINLYGGGLNIVAGWDGNTNVYTSAAAPVVVADTGKGNITVDDSAIFTGEVKWLGAGNIAVSATNVGSVVKSTGLMSMEATNIYLTGGSAYGANPFVVGGGAGVKVESVSGPQTLTAANEIKLQAGSANNDAYGGSPYYGGSAVLKSGGSQSITANALRVLAGSGGHDNAAMVEAWGTQTIVLGSPTTPAVLEIIGGGTNAAGVYGSSVAGAWVGGTPTTTYGGYNNFAQITQESPYGGSQLLIIYGGSVSLQAGNGNGINGLTDDCYHDSNSCNDTPSSSNWALVYNWGYGGVAGYTNVSQALEFRDSSGSAASVVLRGGANGSNNKAEIVNDPGTGSYTSQFIGAAAAADYPNITLYGGANGGYLDSAYGQFVHNGAEIASYANQDSLAGTQVIYGGTIALYGGGTSSSLAPAMFDAGYQTITTTGDLILVGGASTIGADANMGASDAFIGNKLSVQQSINVGNDLIMTGGSGVYGSASIGSARGTVDADIVVGRNVTLTANAGAARIGSLADASYGGASIDLRAGGSISLNGSATRGVSIGSFNDDAAAVVVRIGAAEGITATGNDGGVYIGVTNSSGTYGGSVDLWAGVSAGGSLVASGYGGDISLTNTHIRTGTNSASTLTIGTYGGSAAYGDIALTDVAAESWGGVQLTVARNFSLTGIDHGVLVESRNGMTVGVGGNLTLTGSTLATAYGDNTIGDATLGAGAFLRNNGTGSQNVTVTGDIVMTAGAVDNGVNSGSAFYGGGVAIANWAENASQSVSAHGIAMYGGSGGHDNMAAIMAKGSQTITIAGGQLYMAGGSGAGSYNNSARIEQTYGGAPQTVTVYYGGAIAMYGGSATGTGGWNGGAASGAEIRNYGGAAATQTIDFHDATAYGSLTIVGGSAGTDNRAGIDGGYGSQWIGNTYGGGPAPNIHLTGGSGGGSADHENGAELDLRDAATGSQTINANNLVIDGGSAAYGGAGLGAPTQILNVAGDLTMTGGTSSGYDTVKEMPGSAAYIGSEYGANVTLTVGNDATLQGGSGYGGWVLIGSLRQQASVSVDVSGDVSITAGAAGTGKVAIGSLATAAYGAGVALIAGRDLGLYGGVVGITLGSQYGGVADHVRLGAGATGSVNAASGYGGSITGTGKLIVASKGDVALKAYRENASPYGGGNISLASGADVSGAGIVVVAQGSALLDGSLTAATGYGASVAAGYGGAKTLRVADVYGDSITLTATGDAEITGTVDARTSTLSVTAGQNGYGGSITLGSASAVSAYGGMDLYAYYGGGVGGNIAQTGGSLTSDTASVNLHADRGINLGGNVTGATAVALTAGNAGYGGNLAIGGIIDGGAGSVSLTSSSGSIMQTAGTVYGAGATGINVSAYGDALMDGTLIGASGSGYGVHVTAGSGNAVGKTLRVANVTGDAVMLTSNGNAIVTGDLTSRVGAVTITAGSGAVAGGDINLGSGHTLSGYGGVSLAAYIYGGSVGGNILQTSGNLTSANGSVGLDADYAVNLGGTVSGASGVTANAGKAGFGGNLVVAGAVSSASGYVHLQSYSGTLQTTGAVYGGSYVEAFAYGGAVIGGTVTSPGTVTLKSGYNGAILPTAYNLEIAGDIYGGTVNVQASGAILDSLTNGTTQGNVFAADASFTSHYGGAATGLAISADTQVTGSLSATVMGTATYGGIALRNTGTAAPTTVSLFDNTTNTNSKISFRHSGSDLTLGSNMTFSAYGDIALTAGSNMTYSGAGIGSTAGSILLGASGNMTIAQALSYSGNDIGLTVGGRLDVDQQVYGKKLLVVAPTVDIDGKTAGTNGSIDGVGDVVIVANSVTGYGAGIHSSAGDVAILAAGDMRFNDGTVVEAGLDVELVLTGLNSRLYLNDLATYASPSYVLAGLPTTITLQFTKRPTADGVVINGTPTMDSLVGGSGLFVVDHNTPATAGAGLSLAYNSVAVAPVPVDPCVINPTSCKPPETPTPKEETVVTPPAPTTPTGGLNLPSSGGTVGGTVGEFGGGDSSSSFSGTGGTLSGGTTTNGGATTSGTSGATTPAGTTPPADEPAKPAAGSGESAKSDKSDKPATTAAADKDAGKDAKDAKDDKDKKKEDKKEDKKSDDSSKEKKDDKASGKKPLGKCSV